MDVNIREATIKDYEALCRIFEDEDAYHRHALPHIYKKPDGPARTEEFISSIISNEQEILFIAEFDNNITGVIHISINEASNIPIKFPRHFASIDNIVVAKAHRGKGIGKALMQKAHEWISSKGITQIELNVWEFNQTAIKFYEKLGYTTASRRMWRDIE